jgi:uncharacterized protein YciI
MPSTLFAVIRTHGPAWTESAPIESQSLWQEHADFMDDLFHAGYIVLAGPLEGTNGAMLIFRADSSSEVESRLAADPWTASGHLYTSQISPWTLRLGSLP